MKSDYTVFETDKSYCGECQQKVSLLANENPRSPWFYICWICKKVSQCGVGPVENTTGVEE